MAGTGATSCQVWVATTPGGHDIAAVGTGNLSVTIPGLPQNCIQIYVNCTATPAESDWCWISCQLVYCFAPGLPPPPGFGAVLLGRVKRFFYAATPAGAALLLVTSDENLLGLRPSEP